MKNENKILYDKFIINLDYLCYVCETKPFKVNRIINSEKPIIINSLKNFNDLVSFIKLCIEED